MSGRLLAALGIGIIVGAAGVNTISGPPAALGQPKERKAAWEYKVIYSSTEVKDATKAMTEQYNALAGDGWEYVGPVADHTHARALNGVYSGIDGVCVVFRRTK